LKELGPSCVNEETNEADQAPLSKLECELLEELANITIPGDYGFMVQAMSFSVPVRKCL
jgi:hypothetical protein